MSKSFREKWLDSQAPEPPEDRTGRKTYAELRAECAKEGLHIGGKKGRAVDPGLFPEPNLKASDKGLEASPYLVEALKEKGWQAEKLDEEVLPNPLLLTKKAPG